MSTPGVEHPVAGVILSPSLTCLAADRRLLFAPTGRRVYRPRPHRSTSDVLVALLLLLGGVELNPRPTISARSTPRDALSLGVLNVRSAKRHWSDTQRQHVGPDPVARRTDL